MREKPTLFHRAKSIEKLSIERLLIQCRKSGKVKL